MSLGEITMKANLPRRRKALLAVLGALLIGFVPASAATSVAMRPTPNSGSSVASRPGRAAAAPLTVAQARARQDGSSAQVRGYIVGQPTSSSTVLTSGFPSDNALTIADTAGVTDRAAMLFVQVPASFRAAWGLRSNPALLGRRIDVTGTLAE
jgi:hypothetical protein